MEKGVVAFASPISSVDRVRAEEIECACHEAPVFFRNDQHDLVRHRFAEEMEEFAREIWIAPLSVARVAIEAEERVPMPGLDVVAGKRPNFDTVRHRRLALLADGLALARTECGQEIVEISKARVLPMKLLAFTEEKAGIAQGAPFGLARERDMERGDVEALRHCERSRNERVLCPRRGVGMDEEARARNGGERYRDLELRIIPPARALVCVGPTVVEDVFAIRMDLEVHRCGGEEAARGVFDRDMLWQPTGVFARRAAVFGVAAEAVADRRVR